MKAHGKSTSVNSNRPSEHTAAGSQILSWQDQQQVLLSQTKKNNQTEVNPVIQGQSNHFSSNLLKLHPQPQSQQPSKQNREQQRGQSPHNNAGQQILFHQPQQEIALEHFNSGSKALSSSGKQQIGQMRSNSPSQPHFLKRDPSKRSTIGVPQNNQGQQNLNIKMPQLSENKWGLSSFGVGTGGVHAQHALRMGHGWPHEQFGSEQQTLQSNSTAAINLASMPPAGLASGGGKQQVGQSLGTNTLPGTLLGQAGGMTQTISGQTPLQNEFYQYQFIESAQRVVNNSQKQNSIDWLSEEKSQQTIQQQNSAVQNQNQQNSSIFQQAAASKLNPGRKIGAIHAQHPPPFIQNPQRQKNAPFGTSITTQPIFMNSNSRRNFTSSKEEGSGIGANSCGSNQSASQGAVVQSQPAGGQNSSEGDSLSTCNTRLGGFKAGNSVAGQTAVSAVSTVYNVSTLNASFLANEAPVTEISRTGSKFPKSVAFEIAKPQVIQNRGQSGGQPKKNFRRSNLQQTSTQQLNIVSVGLSLVGQTLQQDSNLNQMTPGSVKDKHKQRIPNAMNETTKSIKLPFQQKVQPLSNLPHSLEKLKEEHMQQAQPTSIRPSAKQNKLNPKLMPPIKSLASGFQESFGAAAQAHQTSFDQIQADQGNKIQIQKDKTDSQAIRNKIKAKLKLAQEIQAVKQQQSGINPSKENREENKGEDPYNLNLVPDKKKLSIHLQVIRSQANKAALKQEDSNEEYLINAHKQVQQQSLSSFSNGTVPNQPPVSPEDHFAAKQQDNNQVQPNAPFSIIIHKTATQQQSPESDQHEQTNRQGIIAEESASKPIKEVSRQHNRLRLIQRQSKRLQFDQVQDQEAIDEGKKLEFVKAQQNANVSSFIVQQLGESEDEFERADSLQLDYQEQLEQQKETESHDSILGKTESSMQMNDIVDNSMHGELMPSQFPNNEVGNGLSMLNPKIKNTRYERDIQEIEGKDIENDEQELLFKVKPLNLQEVEQQSKYQLVPQEQVLSVSGSYPTLPPLLSRAVIEKTNQMQVQGQSALQIVSKAMQKENLKAQLPAQQQLSNNSKSGHPSSDSSFARTFKLLVQESSELRRMYSEILRQQISQQDKVYTKFVYDIHSRIRQYKKDVFYKSMRLERRKRDLIDDELTFDMVVNHIEHEKAKQIHSEKFRFVHSDMSGQHLSNSVNQSYASILSPDSNSFGGAVVGIMRTGRGPNYLRSKHNYYHYNSFSIGLIASSARIFTLPDLNHRHRNSVCNFREVIGLSENYSHRFCQIAKKASSNSYQTTPLTGNSNKNGTKSSKVNIINSKTPRGLELQKSQPETQINLPKSLNQIYRGQKNQIQHKQQSIITGLAGQSLVEENKEKVTLPQLIPMAMEQHQKLNEKFLKDQFKHHHQQFNEQKQKHVKKLPQKIHGKLIQWYEGVLIGQGTTGVVNLAMFKETGAYFVVKKIRLVHSFLGLDTNRVKAIKKEIDMYKTLKHENIVEYYGCEVIENNTMCIYLEYMPGGSIADRYKRFSSNIDEKICRLYTLQILNALHYLHSRDIVHGDLKGANVLLSKDGEKVKLCDLGNARQLESSFSSINTVVNGTLAWMAPEAQFSKIGVKSDIWSLGCLLVEMLTGTNPWGNRFEDGNQAFMLQRALQNEEKPIIPTENTSTECQNFIKRCLKHQYRERPHAQELLEDPWMKQL